MTAAISSGLGDGSDPPPWEQTGFVPALNRASEMGQEFPLLRRATMDMRPAHKTTIEWGGGRGRNFVQLNRNPFSLSQTMLAVRTYGETVRESRDKFMVEHLRVVEQTLEHGVPRRVIEYVMEQDEDGEWGIYECVTQTCGGYRHFLGRDLTDKDTIRLHALRDLTFGDVTSVDLDGRRWEWLSEFSLEVTPA